MRYQEFVRRLYVRHNKVNPLLVYMLLIMELQGFLVIQNLIPSNNMTHGKVKLLEALKEEAYNLNIVKAFDMYSPQSSMERFWITSLKIVLDDDIRDSVFHTLYVANSSSYSMG